MNTVLFVNHQEKNCGVQSYGNRVAKIFKGSKNWNSVYFESDSLDKLYHEIAEVKPTVIVYNYLAQTMAWLTHPAINSIRAAGINQGLIVHNIGYAEIFDFYLHQNPNHPRGGNNFPLLRPLFDYRKKGIGPCPSGASPIIGTFGFALPEKNYGRIAQLVNQQFNEAELRMHLTAAHFRPDQGWFKMIQSECERQITKPGIELKITTDFRDDEAILDFLAGNDLNVFLYQNFSHYNGLSSVIDYALSVRKPIAVCRSGLFAHISDAKPSICVEDRSLPEIMATGFDPVRGFAEEWSQPNFIRHLEGVLDSV